MNVAHHLRRWFMLRPDFTGYSDNDLLSWKQGDRRAGDRFIRRHMGFVMWQTKWLSKRFRIELEEALSCVLLGAIRMASRADTNRTNNEVFGYWKKCSMSFANEYVAESRYPFQMPRRVLSLNRDTIDAIRDAYWKNDRVEIGRLRGKEHIASDTFTSIGRVLTTQFISLDAFTMSDNGDNNKHGDHVEANEETPEYELALERWHEDLRKHIQHELSLLSERERAVAVLRWMHEPEPLTLEQIGNQFGVTRERIRQIELRVAARLRDRLEWLRESKPQPLVRRRPDED